MAAVAISPKRGKVDSDGGDSPRTQHVCQLCNKSYERLDHLNRHLDSHRNERTFKCNDCPRGFNRRDLLLRHQATHAKNAANGKSGTDRSGERAIKACDPCVISKLKCDNSRPCLRCKKRKIECKTDPVNNASSKTSQSGSPISGNDIHASSAKNGSALPSPPDTAVVDGLQYTSGRQQTSSMNTELDARYGQDLQFHATDGSSTWDMNDASTMLPFSTFFDQIMAPDFVASESLNMPPDIFNLMPDKDWMSDTTDIFGLEFTPIVDQAFESQINNFPFPEQNDDSPAAVEVNSDEDTEINKRARQRHAIFQRSQWLWKPEANSNAFSEHRSIPLNESEIDMGASSHQPFLPSLIMQNSISDQSRDKIFQVVLKTAKSHVSIPRFPSTKCLNLLLKVGLAKRMETDAWIHPYTFNSESARPELLIALIAAGCVCFGIPSVSKTGLVLFEIVRVALNRLVEDDNSVIRDLQYLQACMIWIDITAFCGFKRKMEIAEQSLQPLVTALRMAGKFDRVAYHQIKPTSGDKDEVLEQKWKQWAEQESYKRLVHHLFEHDMYTTIAKVRNPLISYAEMSLPLPACRELWLASSPEIWQLTHSRDTRRDTSYATLSIRDLLSNNDLLHCLPHTMDKRLANAIYLHGLAGQSWEYYQQSLIYNSPLASSTDPSTKLWLQSRHQTLTTLLQTHIKGSTSTSTPTAAATTLLLNEFLFLSLYVNPDTITRFAGKCGEAEAHRAYQELQPWSQTNEARRAIWHAGQVVRWAREVPPYQLRGMDAFVIYHALMVVWSWGMMRRDSGTTAAAAASTGRRRREGRDGSSRESVSPMRLDGNERANNGMGGGGISSESSAIAVAVMLDSDSSSSSMTDAFILQGIGRPCLHFDKPESSQLTTAADTRNSDRGQTSDKLCEVQNPQAVMAVGIRVFERNYPNETRQNLPQLIRSLCELMGELGSLT